LNNSDQRKPENFQTRQKNNSFSILTVQHTELVSALAFLKYTGLAEEPWGGLVRWYIGKSEEISKRISQSSLGDWEDAGGCSIISPGAPEAAEEPSCSVPLISCDEFASSCDFACALPRH